MARRGVNLLERDGTGERGQNRKGVGLLFRDENLGATTVSGGLKEGDEEEEEGRGRRVVDERVRR